MGLCSIASFVFQSRTFPLRLALRKGPFLPYRSRSAQIG
jgi:hypothetical protein